MIYPTRALSVRQPWAWAILHAGKDIENRTWWPARYQGARIAIHTSSSRSDQLSDLPIDWRQWPSPGELTKGAIVGVVTIAGFTMSSDSKWLNHDPGNIGWKLRDIVALNRPVPCKGALGLWEMPPALIRRIVEELPA